MNEKECSHCHQKKLNAEFGPSKTTPDGLKYVCRLCDSEIHRRAYAYSPKLFRKRSALNRWKARMEGLCLSCYVPLDGRDAKYCAPCARKNADRQIARRKKNKAACFNAYGGPVCACCGEQHEVVLNLDHINGGGNKHRIALYGRTDNSAALYSALVRTGFPPGFQVLCANCNVAKHRLGVCFHKEN